MYGWMDIWTEVWTPIQTDLRTNVLPRVLKDIVPFGAAAQKREVKEEEEAKEERKNKGRNLSKKGLRRKTSFCQESFQYFLLRRSSTPFLFSEIVHRKSHASEILEKMMRWDMVLFLFLE